MKSETPLKPIEFKTEFTIESVIVISNSSSGNQIYRSPGRNVIGSFTVQCNSDFLECSSSLSDSDSAIFEEFRECFSGLFGEIEERIMNVLGFPRYDHGDGLEDLANSFFWSVEDETAALCDLLELPRIELLKILVDDDGFIVDRVYVPRDLIEDYRRFKSGAIHEDEFIEYLSAGEYEFCVEVHMSFRLHSDVAVIVDELYASGFCDHLDSDDENNDSELRLEELVNRLVGSLNCLNPS